MTQRFDSPQLVYRHLLCGAWQVTPTGAVGAAGLRLSNNSATVCGAATLNAFASAPETVASKIELAKQAIADRLKHDVETLDKGFPG